MTSFVGLAGLPFMCKLVTPAARQADKLPFSDTALKMQLFMTVFVHPVNFETAAA